MSRYREITPAEMDPAQKRVHDQIVAGKRGRFGGPFQLLIRAPEICGLARCVKGDIEAFSEFIRMYLSRYERWSSPLFLLGESYGTTRAAGISGHLSELGINFNGITLLSMVLNFQTLEDTKTNDEPYVYLIPSYTMIAGYHHKLPSDLLSSLLHHLTSDQRD